MTYGNFFGLKSMALKILTRFSGKKLKRNTDMKSDRCVIESWLPHFIFVLFFPSANFIKYFISFFISNVSYLAETPIFSLFIRKMRETKANNVEGYCKNSNVHHSA